MPFRVLAAAIFAALLPLSPAFSKPQAQPTASGTEGEVASGSVAGTPFTGVGKLGNDLTWYEQRYANGSQTKFVLGPEAAVKLGWLSAPVEVTPVGGPANPNGSTYFQTNLQKGFARIDVQGGTYRIFRASKVPGHEPTQESSTGGHPHPYGPENGNGNLHLSSLVPPGLPEPAVAFGQFKYYDQKGVPFPVYEPKGGPQGFFKASNNNAQAFMFMETSANRGTTYQSQGASINAEELTRHQGDPPNFWRDVDEQQSKAILVNGAAVIRYSRQPSDLPNLWHEEGTAKTLRLTGNGQYQATK